MSGTDESLDTKIKRLKRRLEMPIAAGRHRAELEEDLQLLEQQRDRRDRKWKSE